MEKKISVHAIIRGRVQGVCFRAETRKAALHHSVEGWVKNRPDGTVEALFEGAEADVKSVLNWCEKGPSLSRVDQVDVAYNESITGVDGFEITY